jgi:6-phosphogluconolactonase
MTIEPIVREIPELAETFAEHVEAAYGEARRSGRPFSIAVPGGSAAQKLLPRLVKLPLDWRHVLVFFADERAVPPDDPESNVRLVREVWLDRVPIPAGNVYRMRGESPDLDAAASGYERSLAETLGAPPRLDLVLLGMGPDGHVASLFPGAPSLEESKRCVLAVEDAPKPPARRLTLSLLAITRARRVVLAAFGAGKAAAVRDALREGSTLPAALALRSGPIPVVLLDPAAASGLGELATRR